MIHIAWPWMILFLPLPWLLRRWLPPATVQGSALFLPFAALVPIDKIPALQVNSRKRSMLFALAWLLLVAATMRPQWLDDPLPVPTTGRRILLAVDVSGSMATPDMAGNYSRLNVVQKVAGDFIQHRHGDQVGLILFGTRPYLQAPLTADLDTVSQFLRESVVGEAGTQTAIGDAIGLALKRLQSNQADPGKQGEMVLILLTDGGNNAGLMGPLAAAKIAVSTGLRIYTIGVGAEVEQSILFGTRGNTDLDEDTLKSIARISNGEYFRATDADALQEVYARIDKLEPSAGREQWYRPHSEWFIWPLALALLLSIPAVMIRKRV
ncbi:BatA (Bacteroides aerotolerance operon) [Candidatus Nitrotoga sp. BS]|uniref:VWA domain-containing protein n=1 Tax=Candidatus Nitrotoga sp. BS TaxID=2890408 RepID=UPI001EF34328|nr:VWA domain-containing protein [Candidatus Nitrotoga sp. BS]CAH1204151.1 BatA (Bacteroides aerotolerance operon) [Candidatus Nitrotoga sp. BS]